VISGVFLFIPYPAPLPWGFSMNNTFFGDGFGVLGFGLFWFGGSSKSFFIFCYIFFNFLYFLDLYV
jgi:hypothetical protein